MSSGPALLDVATEMFDVPEQVDDVLVWRIRPGVDPVDQAGGELGLPP